MSNIPWQKAGSRRVTPADHRLEMVRAAVGDHPQLVPCDLEVRRGGESSSVDTLEELHAEDPTRQLFFILGADAAAGLRTWRRWERLPELATIVVVDRAGRQGGLVDWPGPVERVVIPRLDISSTEIRRRVAAGEPIDYLVPGDVASVVSRRLLYRGGP